VLDIGCGAGNNTLKFREVLGRDFTADLLDLIEPMVSRAAQRFSKVNAKASNELVGDFRSLKLQEEHKD
jgi:tRNA (cmo5U34)-methyltransferase